MSPTRPAGARQRWRFVLGFEALARLDAPQPGPVSANATFISRCGGVEACILQLRREWMLRSGLAEEGPALDASLSASAVNYYRQLQITQDLRGW